MEQPVTIVPDVAHSVVGDVVVGGGGGGGSGGSGGGGVPPAPAPSPVEGHGAGGDPSALITTMRLELVVPLSRMADTLTQLVEASATVAVTVARLDEKVTRLEAQIARVAEGLQALTGATRDLCAIVVVSPSKLGVLQVGPPPDYLHLYLTLNMGLMKPYRPGKLNRTATCLHIQVIYSDLIGGMFWYNRYTYIPLGGAF